MMDEVAIDDVDAKHREDAENQESLHRRDRTAHLPGHLALQRPQKILRRPALHVKA